jgi:hypothetical protein
MNYLLAALLCIGSSYGRVCVLIQDLQRARFAAERVSRPFIINSLAQQAYENTHFSAKSANTEQGGERSVLFFDRLREARRPFLPLALSAHASRARTKCTKRITPKNNNTHRFVRILADWKISSDALLRELSLSVLIIAGVCTGTVEVLWLCEMSLATNIYM